MAPLQKHNGCTPNVDRANWVMLLRESIECALVQTSPNHNYPDGRGAGRVFNGNFDWHSSVHAHWALLSIARKTNDTALADKVLCRLTPAALALEDKRLKAVPPDPLGEMPYGQSWLLLLLEELGRHPSGARKSPEVEELCCSTEERVLAYLERAPFPEGKRDGSNSLCFNRQHASWLFAYWLFKMSRPSNASARQVADLALRLETWRALVLRQTTIEPRDFLYLPAVLWLVDHTEPMSVSGWRYTNAPVALPAQPVVTKNAHQPGVFAVSLWPHAVQSARGDQASAELFNQSLDHVFSRSDSWRFEPTKIETFVSVGHWVPQFLWMAMVLEKDFQSLYGDCSSGL